MKKKTKKMLMIGAALVGGYMLLAPKSATATEIPMGGSGGYYVTTEGVPESKKERDINIVIEAEKFPSPTGDAATGGSRPYDPSEPGWASTAHAKKLEQMQQSVQYQKSLPTWTVGDQTFAGRGNTTASLVPATAKKESSTPWWTIW